VESPSRMRLWPSFLSVTQPVFGVCALIERHGYGITEPGGSRQTMQLVNTEAEGPEHRTWYLRE